MKVIAGKHLDVRKATVYAVVINALQMLLVLLIAAYVLLDGERLLGLYAARWAVGIAAFIVVSGAYVDIREALSTRRLLNNMDAMDVTMSQVEKLNHTLRAQRHDFMNHLQVVYSLMEMNEYDSAGEYIERVYGDISAVSRVLRTSNTAVNALLQAKLAECEKAGVAFHMDIKSALTDFPVPGWEMCRVLSNLIDNAVDALSECTVRDVTLTITEDLHAFHFSVMNNGPMIPPENQASIFLPGVTTKGEGHGMGLSIVKETLEAYGGQLTVQSDPSRTVFSVLIPRTNSQGALPARE